MSGASPVSNPGDRKTAFLPDVPIRSFFSVYYAGRRFLLGGAPVGRFVSLTLTFLAALWATGLFPGRWIGVALMLFLLVVHIVIGVVLKQRDFIAFHPASLPKSSAQIRELEASLPVYVTGKLSVEGNDRRFTCLPGFYRSFATREHALLCLVRPRQALGVVRWPEDEIGMWYAFFTPESIKRFSWGALTFGPKPMTALAVEYEQCVTNSSRFRKGHAERCNVETLYISSGNEAVLHRIAADLMADSSEEKSTISAQQIGR